MSFFNRQIELIFSKFELKFLLWTVCLINLFTAIHWKTSSQSISEICWPIFASCNGFLTPYLINAMLGVCAVTLLFLFLQLKRLVFPLLTLTFLLKLSLYLLNYSYSDNIHVLIFFIEIVLFLFPLKSINIKIVILMFVFWSGLAKLNLNWLSGLEIKNYLPDLPIKGIEWISAIVVILELISPIILFSKIKVIFHYAWIGLVIYYIGFAVVSKNLLFIIPALLILYIVIYRNSQTREDREKLYKTYHSPETSKSWVLLPVILFLIVNWYPLNSHPIKPLAANPLKLIKRNIPSECLIKTVIINNQTHEFLPDTHIKSTGNDFKCYPEKFKNFSQLCNLSKTHTSAVVTKTLYTKELTDEKFTQIFHSSFNCLTQRLVQ